MSSPSVWNHVVIKGIFLPHDVESILSIPLAAGRGCDTAIWHFRKDGPYTVKSGYRLAMHLIKVRSSAGEEGSYGSAHNGCSIWSKLWRLKVANKVKIFMWRAC